MLGVAIAKRTGERRIVTEQEYLALDAASDARWEFLPLPTGEDGEPDAEALIEFGFTPGGDRIISGDADEVEPGMFRMVEE